ncbi:S8 family serine peptidase [Streptomyces filamentosus]|uniref:S8 family serine peptidase n=1 Tax=Streptomyces filamentosus TaxID=67294 RepID=UPI001F227642|nr:S8 family serine peptidase [Streptomyces filamentosus]
MKRRTGGVVAAVAAALVATVTPVGAGPLAGSAAAATGTGPVAAPLFDRTQDGGTVRVNVVTDQRSTLASVAEAGQTLVSYDVLPMTTLRVDQAGLETLNTTPGVLSVTVDEVALPTLDESTVRTGVDRTVAAGKTGAGAAVAVLDTGVAVNHPFLSGRVKAQACFSDNDPVAGTSSLCPDGSPEQQGPGSADVESGPCAAGDVNCSHGTHVAGIAAGNGAGLTGAPRHGVAPGADIVAIQVFSKFETEAFCGVDSAPCLGSYTSSQIKALEQVLSLKNSGMNIAAVNMSLGGQTTAVACDQDIRKPVIDALRSAGVATVIAAGNNGAANAVSNPGCISSAITVGSTTDEDQLSTFSNRGPLLDLLAPGTTIVSSVPGGLYAPKNGTSMAAPHVAGAFAVLKQAYPTLTVDQLEAKLEADGTPITYTGATTPRLQLDRTLLPSTPKPAVPGDMTGDGKPDMVAIEDTGKLWLYPGLGNGGLGARILIGSGGWSGASVTHRGDWTGDRKEDVVAIVGGELWVYPNRGDGTLGARLKLATLNTSTRVTAPGDVNNDGHPDLLTTYDEGLTLYTGTSGAVPAVSRPTFVGWGSWSSMHLSSAGDADKDGTMDLLGRDPRDGELWLFSGQGGGMFHPGALVEYGRGYFTANRPLVTAAADADLNGVADSWATTNTGTLLFYKGGNNIHGPIDGPSVEVGNGGWQTIKSIS